MNRGNRYSRALLENKPTFQEAFIFVLEHAARVYEAHNPVKGDTWKDCPIQHLEKLLLNEVAEYFQSSDPHNKFVEAIDLVNFALMIAARRMADSPYKGEL